MGNNARPIITPKSKRAETTTVAMGPTLTPLDSSSKKRINPAPAKGMGPSRPRRLDRFDFFLDILFGNSQFFIR